MEVVLARRIPGSISWAKITADLVPPVQVLVFWAVDEFQREEGFQSVMNTSTSFRLEVSEDNMEDLPPCQRCWVLLNSNLLYEIVNSTCEAPMLRLFNDVQQRVGQLLIDL